MIAPYNGLITTDGTVLYVNSNQLALINATLADVAGKKLWDTPWYASSPDAQTTLSELIDNVKHTGIPEEHRVILRFDDTSRSFDILVSAVFSSTGEIVALMMEGVEANHVLNEREKDILTWTARGKTSWEIAVILGISQRTVEWHATQARQKLQANNTIEAVAKAIKSGLINV